VAESQCALLGKSTNLLIAIERPVWLTGRQRQQKAGHCDHPPAEAGVFLDTRRQALDATKLFTHPSSMKRPRAPEGGTRGLLNLARGDRSRPEK
jgi:hypothetical protein